jgi:S1-C subfamily serine protease
LVIVAVAALTGGMAGAMVARLTAPEATPVATVTVTQPGAELSDLPATIAAIRQSVVGIKVTSIVTFSGRPVTVEGAGTGFVLTSDGMIGTDAHVLSGAQQLIVMLPDGTELQATVVGSDSTRDVAVLHVDRTDLIPMPIGSSSDVRVGDEVVVVGNALSLGAEPTASRGIVSALNRTIALSEGRNATGLIQTDAAVNEGNSGGPLADVDGKIIGIVNARTGGAQSIGFAIPIDDVLPILHQLYSGSR